MGKSTKGHGGFARKRTSTAVKSSDSSCPVWLFDKLDKNGEFAFDVNSPDFNHKDFLSKMIEYSLIPWAAIKKQTHDENKSKHHYLDYSSLSKEAQDRIKALDMESLTRYSPLHSTTHCGLSVSVTVSISMSYGMTGTTASALRN